MTFRAVRFWMALVLVVFFGTVVVAQESKKLTPQEVERDLQLAETKEEEGSLPEAASLYLRIVTDYPERHDVRLRLARIYYQLKEYDNAAQSFLEAAEHVSGADQAEAYEKAADALAKTANYTEAVKVGQKAVEANPNSALARINLALGLSKTGALDEAAAMAQKALELAPDSAVAHATIGEAQLAQGNLAEARTAFDKALEIDPDNAEAHAGLADIHFRAGEWDAAIASATKALELNDQLTRAYTLRGMAKNSKGDTSGATSDLSMAITVNPNDADAQFAYGQLLQKQGNITMAAGYYRKAVQLNPEMVEAHLRLGEVLVGQGNYSEAMSHVAKAVERMPDSAQAHYLYGVCLSQDKKFEEALAEFTKAAELDETLAAAHYYRGKILREQKQDVAGALPELEKAIQMEPENPDYLTDYGVALYDAKQPDRALEMLQKAAATPEYNNPLGFAYLGVIFKDKQDFATAGDYFQKAVDLVPNWGLPHWGLAWAHFGMIPKGCPCGPEDEEHVRKIVEHQQKAAELGVNDPALAERAQALQKGEKVN